MFGKLSPFQILIASLIVVSLTIVGLRWLFQSDEAVPVGDRLWQVNFSVTVERPSRDNKLRVPIPLDNEYIRVASQSFNLSEFKLKLIEQSNKGVKSLVLVPLTEDGEIHFNAEYELQVSKTKRWQHWLNNKPLDTEQKAVYLDTAKYENDKPAVIELLRVLQQDRQEVNTLIERIFKYVHNDIVNAQSASGELAKSIAKRRGSVLDKAQLMVALLRYSAIPARLATGVIVEEKFDASEHYWVEAYVDERWQSYDPSLGYRETLPETFLRLNTNSYRTAYLDDGTDLDMVIDIIQQPALAGRMGSGKKKLLDILDLSRLPLDSQFLLITVLLLPLGALLTTLFSMLVGARTYGSFTPSLIAMTIIHAEWFTVLTVAAIVIAIGLLSRSAIPDKTSKVPRLSVLFTVVALAMVLSVSVMDYFGLNPDAKVVLLPIIVLTNLVDRFYSVMDEQGPFTASYRLIWTAIVTLGCILLFAMPLFQQTVLNYPEMHLMVLALILLLGQYKGKKLSDMPRFSWIKEPRKALQPADEKTASA